MWSCVTGTANATLVEPSTFMKTLEKLQNLQMEKRVPGEAPVQTASQVRVLVIS